MAPKKKSNRKSNSSVNGEVQNHAADPTSKSETASKGVKNELILNGHGLHNGCCNGSKETQQQQDGLKSTSPVSELVDPLERVQLSQNAPEPPPAIDPPPSIDPAAPDMLGKVTFVQYESELQMPDIMRLIQKDLSEPYSIYTYRYFIHNWPMLCFLVGRDMILTFS